MRRILASTSFGAALALCGCVGGMPSSSTNSSAPAAELHFSLTDAPGPYDKILVHVVAVDVHRKGDADAEAADGGSDDSTTPPTMPPETTPPSDAPDGGVSTSDVRQVESVGDAADSAWVRIATPDQVIDLLTLSNGVTLDLGGTNLPAGDYDMMRLVVSDGSVVVGGQTYPLTVPSGMNSGIKMRYQLSLTSDVSTTITIDFDGNASVIQTGNGSYLLSPVLRVKGREDHPRAHQHGRPDGGAEPGDTSGEPGGMQPAGVPDGGMGAGAHTPHMHR
jgi:hypothetical protein